MAAKNLELRQKISGSFNHGTTNESLIYIRTHINQVDGLLTNGKFSLNLVPSALLETRKLAGTIAPISGQNYNLADALATIALHHGNQTVLYPGSYLVSKGVNKVLPATDHIVEYADDGLGTQTGVTLENGDMLYYIRGGSSVFSWNEVDEDLYDAVGFNGSMFYATLEDLANKVILAPNEMAVVTGYKWIRSSQSEYDSAPAALKQTTAAQGGAPTEEIMNAVIPPLRLHLTKPYAAIDGGGGYDYWKLIEAIPGGYTGTFAWGVGMFRSIKHTAVHVWGVINNTYNLASKDAQGLISAADFAKLRDIEPGANKYIHHTQTGIDVSASTIDTIKTLTIDTEGHVTAAITQPIRVGDNSNTGLVRLVNISTITEWRTGQPDTIATTPHTVKSMLDYFSGLKVYNNIGTDNSNASGKHPDGALALFAV